MIQLIDSSTGKAVRTAGRPGRKEVPAELLKIRRAIRYVAALARVNRRAEKRLPPEKARHAREQAEHLERACRVLKAEAKRCQ